MGMKISGLDAVIGQMDLRSKEVQGKCQSAVKAAGRLLQAALKERLRGQNVSGRATGELADSIKVDPVKASPGGGWYTKVHPDGYDSKGQPLPLIGNVLEHGRASGAGCYPWMQPTVDREEANIREAMKETFEK